MNIYVETLSFDATNETLRQAFEAFDQVTSATVVKNKYSGQSRGLLCGDACWVPGSDSD